MVDNYDPYGEYDETFDPEDKCPDCGYHVDICDCRPWIEESPFDFDLGDPE